MKKNTPDPEARAYFEEVLALRPNGKTQREARCPFHEDKRKSLSVNVETGLWKCHAGCGGGNRRQFEDRFAMASAPVHEPSTKPNGKTGWEAVTQKFDADYEYTDAAGNLLFRKLRYPGKKFSTQGWDGAQWVSELEKGTARPLYNLPAVRAAKKIVFCEGEKDADRLADCLRRAKRKGFAATTNFDGAAGAFRPEYAEALAGKEVIILPDNDDAGRQHAEIFARGAAAVAATVKVLALPDLPDKGDVSDYLDAHPGKEFLSLLEKAPAWEDPVDSLFVTAADFAKSTPEKTPWVVEGLVAQGSSTQLIAKNKGGKSTLTHFMIRAVLEGKPFLELKTVRSPVVYLTEMPESDLRAELKSTGLLTRDDLHILLWHRALRLSWAEAVAGARARCRKVGALLLVVDTFSVWTRIKDENSSSETLLHLTPLQEAVAEGLGVWIESHERKSGGEIADAGRGSGALSGAVGIVVTLRPPVGKHPPSYRAINVVGRHGMFERVIQLTETDYVVLGTKNAVAHDAAQQKIVGALPNHPAKALGLKKLMEELPPKTSRSTVQRVLEELRKSGFVDRVGSAYKNNPWRYYLRVSADPSAAPKSRNI